MMSESKRILEIFPDGRSGYNTDERFVFHGFVCPNCQGRGWMLICPESRNGPDGADCTRCGGSGKLRAMVQVAWEGDT